MLCIYCRGANRIMEVPSSGGGPVIQKQEVDKQIAEQVIQLILDGKRDEAVALYAREAQVDGKQAEAAVGQLADSLVIRMGKHLPIAWRALPVHLLILSALGVGSAYAMQKALTGTQVLGILAVLLAALCFFGLRVTIRHVWSRVVADWGSEGHARVMRKSILRPGYRRGGTLLVVEWEVRPQDGSAPFRDDETMLVRDESVSKLDPGNIVAVRFNRGHTLVFPESPIRVLGRG